MHNLYELLLRVHLLFTTLPPSVQLGKGKEVGKQRQGENKRWCWRRGGGVGEDGSLLSNDLNEMLSCFCLTRSLRQGWKWNNEILNKPLKKQQTTDFQNCPMASFHVHSQPKHDFSISITLRPVYFQFKHWGEHTKEQTKNESLRNLKECLSLGCWQVPVGSGLGLVSSQKPCSTWDSSCSSKLCLHSKATSLIPSANSFWALAMCRGKW